MKWNFKPSQTPKPVENQRVFLCKIIWAYPRGRFLFKPENISNFRQKKPGHGVGLLRAAVLLKNRAFSFRYLFIPACIEVYLRQKISPVSLKELNPAHPLCRTRLIFKGKIQEKPRYRKYVPDPRATFRGVPEASPTLGHLFGKSRKPTRPSGNVSGSTGSIPDPRATFREVPKASPILGRRFGEYQKFPRPSGDVSGGAESLPDPRA